MKRSRSDRRRHAKQKLGRGREGSRGPRRGCRSRPRAGARHSGSPVSTTTASGASATSASAASRCQLWRCASRRTMTTCRSRRSSSAAPARGTSWRRTTSSVPSANSRPRPASPAAIDGFGHQLEDQRRPCPEAIVAGGSHGLAAPLPGQLPQATTARARTRPRARAGARAGRRRRHAPPPAVPRAPRLPLRRRGSARRRPRRGLGADAERVRAGREGLHGPSPRRRRCPPDRPSRARP